MAPPQTTDSPAVPDLLTQFVAVTPGIDNALVFTRDSLVYAYSADMAQVEAEQWASVTGAMFIMTTSWAKTNKRGTCEHIVHRDATSTILIMRATPATGLTLFLAPGAGLKECALAGELFLLDLVPHLPQVLSEQVGGRLLMGAQR
ncbi:roadblock/LC7 domain-containing protein [Nocardiopsis dassonvillei]